MVKKITKYAKFVVCCALIMSLVAPSYAALSASDGSAFVTKAEFDSALADFNARLTTFEAGINSKIDSQVTSYLDRNGIWNGAKQKIIPLLVDSYANLDDYVNGGQTLSTVNKAIYWDWENVTWQKRDASRGIGRPATISKYGIPPIGFSADILNPMVAMQALNTSGFNIVGLDGSTGVLTDDVRLADYQFFGMPLFAIKANKSGLLKLDWQTQAVKSYFQLAKNTSLESETPEYYQIQHIGERLAVFETDQNVTADWIREKKRPSNTWTSLGRWNLVDTDYTSMDGDFPVSITDNHMAFNVGATYKASLRFVKKDNTYLYWICYSIQVISGELSNRFVLQPQGGNSNNIVGSDIFSETNTYTYTYPTSSNKLYILYNGYSRNTMWDSSSNPTGAMFYDQMQWGLTQFEDLFQLGWAGLCIWDASIY